MEEKRESNPIVGRVLEHTACSMGLAVPSTNRRTDDTLATVDSGLGVAMITTTGGTSKNDDENFVTSLLTVIGHGILAGKYLAEYRDSLK